MHTPADEHPHQPSATNWEQLDQLTDEQIDTSDSPPLSESFFSRATLHSPRGKVAVTVSLDQDIIDWFRARGGEYQQRINAALRSYVEAHKEAA